MCQETHARRTRTGQGVTARICQRQALKSARCLQPSHEGRIVTGQQHALFAARTSDTTLKLLSAKRSTAGYITCLFFHGSLARTSALQQGQTAAAATPAHWSNVLHPGLKMALRCPLTRFTAALFLSPAKTQRPNGRLKVHIWPYFLSLLGPHRLARRNLSVKWPSRHTPSSLLTSNRSSVSVQANLSTHLVSFGMSLSQWCMTAMAPFVFCLTQHCGLITLCLHAIAAPTTPPSRHRRHI